ncbi:MAG TPA: hypothetical protein GXZ51_04145 [Acholeplasma sp.]|jgi:hypothetical protein|nr:hypothetical protein [Acholeplasma sp.]
MAKKEKKEKDPVVVTKKRRDDSIEVEIKKSPAKTTLGKITIVLIIIGTIVIPVVALIFLLSKT